MTFFRRRVSAPWENVILFILNAVSDLCGLATDQIAQTALSTRLPSVSALRFAALCAENEAALNFAINRTVHLSVRNLVLNKDILLLLSFIFCQVVTIYGSSTVDGGFRCS